MHKDGNNFEIRKPSKKYSNQCFKLKSAKAEDLSKAFSYCCTKYTMKIHNVMHRIQPQEEN